MSVYIRAFVNRHANRIFSKQHYIAVSGMSGSTIFS